jgi:hypothetical protein
MMTKLAHYDRISRERFGGRSQIWMELLKSSIFKGNSPQIFGGLMPFCCEFSVSNGEADKLSSPNLRTSNSYRGIKLLCDQAFPLHSGGSTIASCPEASTV